MAPPGRLAHAARLLDNHCGVCQTCNQRGDGHTVDTLCESVHNKFASAQEILSIRGIPRQMLLVAQPQTTRQKCGVVYNVSTLARKQSIKLRQTRQRRTVEQTKTKVSRACSG